MARGCLRPCALRSVFGHVAERKRETADRQTQAGLSVQRRALIESVLLFTWRGRRLLLDAQRQVNWRQVNRRQMTTPASGA